MNRRKFFGAALVAPVAMVKAEPQHVVSGFNVPRVTMNVDSRVVVQTVDEIVLHTAQKIRELQLRGKWGA